MPRRIRRREKLFLVLAGYRTFMYAWNQFAYTYPANTGKDSCGGDLSLPSSDVTYSIMYAQYFALINWNLNLQFNVKASFSRLLILLIAESKNPSRDLSSSRGYSLWNASWGNIYLWRPGITRKPRWKDMTVLCNTHWCLGEHRIGGG